MGRDFLTLLYCTLGTIFVRVSKLGTCFWIETIFTFLIIFICDDICTTVFVDGSLVMYSLVHIWMTGAGAGCPQLHMGAVTLLPQQPALGASLALL